jgi:hypothetical protein
VKRRWHTRWGIVEVKRMRPRAFCWRFVGLHRSWFGEYRKVFDALLAAAWSCGVSGQRFDAMPCVSHFGT